MRGQGMQHEWNKLERPELLPSSTLSKLTVNFVIGNFVKLLALALALTMPNMTF